MEESSRVISALIKRINYFDGKQSRYDSWAEDTRLHIEFHTPDVAKLIEGKKRPSSSGTGTNSSSGTGQEQDSGNNKKPPEPESGGGGSGAGSAGSAPIIVPAPPGRTETRAQKAARMKAII